MANNNAPFGLQPVNRYGTPFWGIGRKYYIPSSYGTALYIGDPVVKTGTANTAKVVQPGYGYFDIATLPEINKAADGANDKITGVIMGFAPLVSDLSKAYNPASTERIAFVYDDPNAVFLVQADAAIGATEIGLNANLVFTQSGSTVTGLSGVEVGASSAGADTTYQVTILGVYNAPFNEPNAARNILMVRINLHTEAYGVVGI